MDAITNEIWIGNYLDARDLAQIRTHGIRSVLCLDENAVNEDFSGTKVAELEVVPLIDGPGNSQTAFAQAVKRLHQLVRTASPVLVHCHHP